MKKLLSLVLVLLMVLGIVACGTTKPAETPAPAATEAPAEKPVEQPAEAPKEPEAPKETEPAEADKLELSDDAIPVGGEPHDDAQ